MKKLMAMLICTMMFGAVNIASAYTYTENMIIDELLTTRIKDSNTTTWSYTLSDHLNLNDISISSATLLINAFSANGTIDVKSGDERIGDLKGGVFQITNPDTNTFQIGSDILAKAILHGGKLEFSATADDKFVYLWDSVLTINYDKVDPFDHSNNNGNNAPVPEPATLLLLGSGLCALAFWGKRRGTAA